MKKRMPRVVVGKDDGTEIFDGNLEVVEGGIEKNGEPSFHIDVRDSNLKSLSIFMYFNDIAEFNGFIELLVRQISKP